MFLYGSSNNDLNEKRKVDIPSEEDALLVYNEISKKLNIKEPSLKKAYRYKEQYIIFIKEPEPYSSKIYMIFYNYNSRKLQKFAEYKMNEIIGELESLSFSLEFMVLEDMPYYLLNINVNDYGMYDQFTEHDLCFVTIIPQKDLKLCHTTIYGHIVSRYPNNKKWELTTPEGEAAWRTTLVIFFKESTEIFMIKRKHYEYDLKKARKIKEVVESLWVLTNTETTVVNEKCKEIKNYEKDKYEKTDLKVIFDSTKSFKSEGLIEYIYRPRIHK